MPKKISLLARLAQVCQEATRIHGEDIARIDAFVARWRADLEPADRNRLDAAITATRPGRSAGRAMH